MPRPAAVLQEAGDQPLLLAVRQALLLAPLETAGNGQRSGDVSDALRELGACLGRELGAGDGSTSGGASGSSGSIVGRGAARGGGFVARDSTWAVGGIMGSGEGAAMPVPAVTSWVSGRPQPGPTLALGSRHTSQWDASPKGDAPSQAVAPGAAPVASPTSPSGGRTPRSMSSREAAVQLPLPALPSQPLQAEATPLSTVAAGVSLPPLKAGTSAAAVAAATVSTRPGRLPLSARGRAREVGDDPPHLPLPTAHHVELQHRQREDVQQQPAALRSPRPLGQPEQRRLNFDCNVPAEKQEAELQPVLRPKGQPEVTNLKARLPLAPMARLDLSLGSVSPQAQERTRRRRSGMEPVGGLVNRVRELLERSHGSVVEAWAAFAAGSGTSEGRLALGSLRRGLVEAGITADDASSFIQAMMELLVADTPSDRPVDSGIEGLSLVDFTAALAPWARFTRPGGLPQSALDAVRMGPTLHGPWEDGADSPTISLGRQPYGISYRDARTILYSPRLVSV